MNNKQRISIITPSYNDGDTLELHIKTFLDQDYPKKELIIIDDGSKDNTEKILRKYEKNKEIKVIRFKKNKGACVARNEGAKIATGDVYSFLPADSFLNPGLLRVWMNMLHDNPDCAFIYGGYKFVDNKINKPTWLGGRLVTAPYLSEPFNPHVLKTQNYIDGSFPIRAKDYWAAAEKVGLKDGLWNPAVKSLQDWDFWLSVVHDYGAKGKYFTSAFFETTMPHPGGLSFDSSKNWMARINQIKALHGIPEAKVCVTASNWAPLHGKGVAEVLDADYREYPPMKPHNYETIYVVGGFFYNFEFFRSIFMSPSFMPKIAALKAAGEWNGIFPMSQAKKIIHFIGSDLLLFRQMTMDQIAQVRAWLKSCEAVLCEIPAIQKELKAYGIDAEVVPFPPKKWYDVEPLPKKKAIAIYLPEDNGDFYFEKFFTGSKEEKGLVHMMKDVDFHFFGNDTLQPPHKATNFKIWGKTNGVGEIIKETGAIIRFTKHDGLPISVAEWIGAGRNALTTIKMPYAEHFDMLPLVKKDLMVKDVLIEMKKAIYKTLKKPLNTKGAKHYRKWLDADEYRAKISQLCEYDEKRYWEKRADSWDKQAQTDKVKKDKLRGIIQSLSFDSVLDVGCGNGRFTPLFDDKEYSGFDISERLIEICKEYFPKKDFFVSSVEEVDKHVNGKIDLLFCYTTLEHVPPQNIQKAVDALKKVGKQLLLIEPKDFTPFGNYCFNHQYSKYFNIRKRWGMGDKVAMLIDLNK